ncbi:hypothetical protein LJC58_10510 [Lachnospiraceae bacterium OttesenSCG-928-D06]|nr:hypothetical protein [Lachnospiraceae bacterium OttesenSCG-928-D06]
MLKFWMPHTDYISFISVQISSLSLSDRIRLDGLFSHSLEKLTSLNLDPILALLLPYYSTTGRPALFQPEIIRSFILMLDTKETSIKRWIHTLHSNPLMAFLIGCSPGCVPSLGAHYDFISRLWLRDKDIQKQLRLRKHKFNFFVKPKKLRLKKGEKLPLSSPGVVKKMAAFFRNDRSFSGRAEKLLQQLFVLAAVVPSVDLGLILPESLTVSGDGTCLPVPSSHYGIKDCDCLKNGIWGCKCERRYSDADARWGWDSSKEQWFYGHTIYLLSCYNKLYHVDLPLYFRFVGANRHDSVSGIVAMGEFRELCPDLPIKNIVLDSAHDNYPTYHLCSEWNITPFIDLNPTNNGNLTYPSAVSVNEKGVPICMGGHPMVNWGICNDKNRRKWRCPLACGKIEECSCKEQCSPSEYGRVIYTKPSDDLRIFTPVPRGTKAFKDIFKTRTCSERVNNRILNDYNVEHMQIRGKKRYSFFTMIASILIHLDARLKQKKQMQVA